ncbi:hypothetical protein F4809DRAFT_639268 [Biscogniauxia mediterranea]|nr:hypothetical protein F4809DRAFT_639268 [Biscogniauxia mediterranea]
MFGKAHPGSQISAEMIGRRQYVEQDDGRLVWFWYTKTGVIVKWSLFLAFLVLITAWMVGGRIHAKRRMKKGLKPMGYHAWLLSRQERARVDPAFAWPQATYVRYQGGPPHPPPAAGPGGYYGMQGYSAPPPVYDPNRPPMYEGEGVPMAGAKVDPNQGAFANQQQQQQQQGVDYAPPSGPPPAR